MPESDAGPGKDIWVAGVDGCAAGWIALLRSLTDPADTRLHVFAEFSNLLDFEPFLQVIAVDMPIGLPDRIGSDGRGPEKSVRPNLGQRQSSVFSVPSRAAVYTKGYRDACAIALATSEPPKKISKQAFYLFPKIREIDALMTPDLESRIYEVHPELAFWRLNDKRAMELPKKIKGRANPDGLKQRRDLLVACGLDRGFLDQAPPKGCGRDDVLDAAVNCLIAEHIHAGKAEPFPKDYQRDARGLRIAIWA